MTSGPLVSVVLPVFKPGPGIARCIESLRSQTLGDIELIFVDDRADDGSMASVYEAAGQDSRIVVVSNPRNMGSGPSRNAGLERAHGAYVSFVDPDDYVAPDFLELLYQKACVHDLDIVKGVYASVVEQDDPAADGDAVPDTATNDSIRAGIARGEPLFCLFEWQHQAALYNTRFLARRAVRYGCSRNAQDTTFLLRACSAAESFDTEDRAVYYYVRRTGSAVRNFGEQRLRGELEGLAEKFAFLESSVIHDRHAFGYAYRQIAWNLRVQNHASVMGGLADDAARYLAGIADAVRNLSFVDELASRYREVRALVEEGANLALDLFERPVGEELSRQECLRIFANWVEYALARPDEMQPHSETWAHLMRTYTRVLGVYRDAVERGGSGFDATAYLGAFLETSKRLKEAFPLSQPPRREG